MARGDGRRGADSSTPDSPAPDSSIPDSPTSFLPTLTRTRARVGAATLSVVAAVAVFLLATQVFPYHSINHDEGVYLQQAAMLLRGRLFLDPPVAGAFRPWFFVDAPQGHPGFVPGGDLYAKYSPVAPAMFAAGKLLGGFRLALAVIAAGTVVLTYAVVAEAFDRRHGLLAAGFLLASPLFLIDSAVILSYAPTTLLNLTFALGYLRAVRYGGRESAEGTDTGKVPPNTRRALGYAAVAGGAIGLAFFSRPYTAVLFAAPFVVHAAWSLRGAARAVVAGERSRVRADLEVGGPVARALATGLVGLGGVALALGYNAAVTGDPLLFPYQAFAPADGLGFGHRQILGYGREYTPALALRANAQVLAALFTRWVAAGPLGSALAAVGLGWLLVRWRRDERVDPRRLVLAGLFVSVAAGNVYFWGNLNVLGDLADPTDGLIAFLGPYYHFDLLVPTAGFAAHGALALGGRVWARVSAAASDRRARAVAAAGLLVVASVFGAAAVATAADPIQRNQRVTQQLAVAYEPFAEAGTAPAWGPGRQASATGGGGPSTGTGGPTSRSFEHSVVFLPTPYGDWLNHPFQALRNDPGFDGDTVYALREHQFGVVDAYPNRSYYRYTYRGQWAPQRGTPIEPRVQRVEHVRGERLGTRVDMGVPAGPESVTLRLASEDGSTHYVATGTPETLSVTLRVAAGRARVTGPVSAVGEDSIPVAGGEEELLLTAFVDYGAGSGFSYRVALPISTAADGDGAGTDGDVRALTPYLEVCRVPTRCGGEAAYVPSATRPGVWLNASVSAD